SKDNTFSMKSTSTMEMYHETGSLKEVTLRDGKVLVEGIVDGMFNTNTGVANVSSSQVSITDAFEGSEDMDDRLKCWQNVLRDRLKIQKKIWHKTGKKPNEMLFNLPVSVEQRDKGTIQRLMDYAARMNPEALSQKEPSTLPEVFNEHTCMYIPKVMETLPTPEQTGGVNVEVSGIPKTIKKELFWPARAFRQQAPNQKNKWLNSKVLEEELIRKEEDIKRVLPHCPDINKLEVVGIHGVSVDETEPLHLIESEDLRTLSSATTSSSSSDSRQENIATPELSPIPEEIKVGLKINGTIYSTNSKLYPPVGDLYFDFECEPYQIQVKEVLRLENVGKKVMVCDWTRNYDGLKPGYAWNECERCFLFDHSLTMLFPGEVYIAKAIFCPRVVSLGKQRWELKLFPNIFCIRRPTFFINLQGKCVPSAMYENKIERLHRTVVDKCNYQSLSRLPIRQGKLAPSIQSPELLCPYERALDDREIFNAQNVGHHCDRYEDLEDLRTLYNSIKVPRAPAWDLRLETIRQTILRLPVAEIRAEYFQKLIDIQELMKFCGDKHADNFDHSNARNRTRLIYVRGCIANGIEEWEELMLSIESSCLKSEYANFLTDEVEKPCLLHLTYENIHKCLLTQLRAKKYYRDSLYMQTYTLMCDIAENIVSIIESTEYI
ncbi:hypothetical protein KR215_010557, partial [Drosophila sulfurigaster]